MKKNLENFEVILPESTLLDSEMEALRGGANDEVVKCGKGIITTCDIGNTEVPGKS